MTVPEFVISIRELRKSYGNLQALDRLTLNIESGVTGLIGPNGAGKTTLIRTLLGLLRPDGGIARVLGHNVVTESIEVRRRVRVLHEKAYFPPSMTPSAFLKAANRFHGTDSDIYEILSRVGILHAADKQIRHLSAGMYQRLGFAQTLVGNPRLIFLDEPTSHLDVRGRDEVVSLIVKLHKEEDISFLISSHILSELERACHSVAFIKKGRLFDYGPVDKLIAKHTRNRYQIITSDAHQLSKHLKENANIEETLVLGVASLVVEGHSDLEGDIESLVRDIAVQQDIEIYKIEPSRSLEEVYRKVIGAQTEHD